MIRTIKRLLIPTLSISASILLAQQAFGLPLPHINEGESYAELREELLKIGYQPLEVTSERVSFAGDVYRRTGWGELEDCAGTGLGLCRFVFIDNYGNKLVIITANNEEAISSNQRHLIYGWRYEETQ